MIKSQRQQKCTLENEKKSAFAIWTVISCQLWWALVYSVRWMIFPIASAMATTERMTLIFGYLKWIFDRWLRFIGEKHLNELKPQMLEALVSNDSKHTRNKKKRFFFGNRCFFVELFIKINTDLHFDYQWNVPFFSSSLKNKLFQMTSFFVKSKPFQFQWMKKNIRQKMKKYKLMKKKGRNVLNFLPVLSAALDCILCDRFHHFSVHFCFLFFRFSMARS